MVTMADCIVSLVQVARTVESIVAEVVLPCGIDRQIRAYLVWWYEYGCRRYLKIHLCSMSFVFPRIISPIQQVRPYASLPGGLG